ncbi:MAG: lipocalin-like domain-containing protein [Gemmatimonadota bacterium]|nr:lipocalin-like domain-containing protein [Gemmatimonadota bacterium]MDH5761301.1 lipocalin-like domain-containing protein [Gemmatimonadota bacterium]
MSVRVRWASACFAGVLLSQVPAIRANDPTSMSPPSRDTSLATQLLGTWRLVAVTEEEDARVMDSPDYGPNPAGYLMYDSTGHVCAQLIDTSRPTWSDEDFPTPDEALSAIMGFGGYCGRYEVHADEHYVVHFPKVAIAPNWIGQAYQRTFELSGDRLELRSAARRVSDGSPVTHILTWTRVK